MAFFEFRRMLVTDLDAVHEIETRAYAFPWTRGNFADSVDAAGFDCRLMTARSAQGVEILGHGVLSFGAGEAHLLNICIRRDRQGEGLGRRLAHHLIERAAGLDATVMFLEVRPSNFAALTLYDRLGFRPIGVRRDYYPAFVGHEDATVMALEIPSYLAAQRV